MFKKITLVCLLCALIIDEWFFEQGLWHSIVKVVWWCKNTVEAVINSYGSTAINWFAALVQRAPFTAIILFVICCVILTTIVGSALHYQGNEEGKWAEIRKQRATAKLEEKEDGKG